MLNTDVVQTLASHCGALGPVPGDFRCHSGTVEQVSYLNLFFLQTTVPSFLHSYLSMADGQVKT
jgi:hypothetical protein